MQVDAIAQTVVVPDGFAERAVSAYARLVRRLRAVAPTLAGELVPWMEARAAKSLTPEKYFLHPLAIPLLLLLLLPWWLDEALGGVDAALHDELIYSSMSGYYVIRLIDDVMDRSDVAEARLLPAVCVLQAEFHVSYAALFPSDHPFWQSFFVDWARAHQAAVEETALTDIDEPTFVRVSAQKVSAGILPLRAVALRKGLAAIPTDWMKLFEALCVFHQRHNDLFDWKRDLGTGAHTWILSDGNRRKRADESMLAWMVREGFEHGLARLTADLDALDALAAATDSASLMGYLSMRRALLRAAADDARAGLAAVGPLLAALHSTRS